MSDPASNLRDILAREAAERAAVVAAILAEPEEVQKVIRRELADYVRDAKHDEAMCEAAQINTSGVLAQIEYLSEDTENYPVSGFAETIEYARRTVERTNELRRADGE